MLVLGDEGGKRFLIPWVTASLILLNLAAFGLQKWFGEPFTYGFSLVPAEITSARDLTKPEKIKVYTAVPHPDPKKREAGHLKLKHIWVNVPQHPGPFPIFLTLLTSMFLHGDWVHLISNMWFLGVFGRNVESSLHHGRFLLFYVVTGIVGGLCHVLSDPHSVIPCLGASGAISGVMGAYIAVFPLNKIKIWLGLWIGVIEMPALLFLGMWFLWQYVCAIVVLQLGELAGGGGVAYWDHIGGFVSGVLIIRGAVFILRRQKARALAAAEAAEPDPTQEADALFANARTATPSSVAIDLPRNADDLFERALPPRR
jgi:membrane associated rhomboid family serine protease